MRLLIPAAVMLVYACGASTPEPASAPTPALDSGSRVEDPRSEEHTSELQSRLHLVCRLLLEKKKKKDAEARLTASACQLSPTAVYLTSQQQRPVASRRTVASRLDVLTLVSSSSTLLSIATSA